MQVKTKNRKVEYKVFLFEDDAAWFCAGFHHGSDAMDFAEKESKAAKRPFLVYRIKEKKVAYYYIEGELRYSLNGEYIELE